MSIKKMIRFLPASIRRILSKQPCKPIEVERAEWSFYLSNLCEEMIVFDVGAYVGELTLLFSRFVGEKGQVHAFEANGQAFNKMKALCHAAGRSNIFLNHLALAEKQGMAELNVYDSDHLSWSSLAERPLHNYGIDVKPVGKEKVITTTVDTYCNRHDINNIDLLKVDVEGAEYQVLLGARQMLEAKRIRCCVFEFGQTTFDMGNNPEDIRTYLAELGYNLENIVEEDPLFPGGESVQTACFSMCLARPI